MKLMEVWSKCQLSESILFHFTKRNFMNMQKPGPRERSSSIDPGPRAAVECKTRGSPWGGCWCLELTDALFCAKMLWPISRDLFEYEIILSYFKHTGWKCVQIVLEILEMDNMNIQRNLKFLKFQLSQGSWKNELFSQETYHTQNIRVETLKSRFKKKLSVFPHLILCESHKPLEVCYCQFHALPKE